MFFLARLLALHLIAPWHLLLILNCFSFVVVSAPPVIRAIRKNTLEEPALSQSSFYYVIAIVCIPVVLLGMARKITRARAAAQIAAE